MILPLIPSTSQWLLWVRNLRPVPHSLFKCWSCHFDLNTVRMTLTQVPLHFLPPSSPSSADVIMPLLQGKVLGLPHFLDVMMPVYFAYFFFLNPIYLGQLSMQLLLCHFPVTLSTFPQEDGVLWSTRRVTFMACLSHYKTLSPVHSPRPPVMLITNTYRHIPNTPWYHFFFASDSCFSIIRIHMNGQQEGFYQEKEHSQQDRLWQRTCMCLVLWFSTFLMPWPFYTAPHVVVIPQP